MRAATALLLLALPLGAAQSESAMDRGLKALEAQQFDAAIQAFHEAVAADSKDYAAYFHLALAHALAGHDGEAAAGYRKVLELKPGLYEAELNLGLVLLRQKQALAAIPLLEAAHQKKPAEFRPAFYLAEALGEAGEWARAEPPYRVAVAADAKSAQATLGLARSLARQKKLAEAAPLYAKAAELDSAFRDALLELASMHEAAGQRDEAVRLYAGFSDNPAARERMGELLLEAGKVAEAIPHLEAAVARSPTPANRFALATAYQNHKQPERALPLLEQAVAGEPRNLRLRLNYGRALRDQRQFSAAAREFFRATQLQPDSVEAWNELAAMLILLENFPEALASLDRIRQLGAERPPHHYLRALLLDKQQQWKPALENYTRFLELSQNQYPDEEFKARQRVRVIQKELNRR